MGLLISADKVAEAMVNLRHVMQRSWMDYFALHFIPSNTIRFDLLDASSSYGKHIAGFQLIQQPNCCGILISTQTYVIEEKRGQGIAQELMKLKIALAREFNYPCMLATARLDNEVEIHILEKFGWERGHEFLNNRTDNQLAIYTLDIPKEELE